MSGITYYPTISPQKSVLTNAAGTPLATAVDPDMGELLGVVTLPKGWLIAEGILPNHKSYRAFGYDATIAAGLPFTDLTGNVTAIVPLPATAITMEVISTSANDAGTLITSGTSTGGSTTTLIDTGKDFVVLGILAGDIILNDTDNEMGIVVTIDSTTQLTFMPVAENSFALKAYRIARTASTGASVVECHGLDSNWLEQSEFVITNGLNPVSTTKQYIRSNNFHVMAVGTNGTAVGDISLRNVGGPTIYNFIGLGGNMSLQCHYTAPGNKNMFITSWHGGSSGNKPLRILLRAQADFVSRAYLPGVFHFHDIIVCNNTDVQHKYDLPIKIPPKASVKISASVIGAGTGECGAGFEYWLEPV
jgi:hypothetical protein